MQSVILAPANKRFPKPAVVPLAHTTDAPAWGFPEWFIISQMVIPALLYLPGSNAYRLPIRVAPFAISLLGFLYLPVKSANPVKAHPARRWLIAAMAYLGAMMFHPNTNSFLSGAAQVMLYLCVMAPLFWVPPLIRDSRHLVRLLSILLVCNGINAAVGILQVYDPDHWMPAEISKIVQESYDINSLSYTRPDGKVIIRPPGLSDNPGAVCGPSMVAAMLGLSFCVSPISLWKKGLCLIFGLAGVMAIYLSLVRTSLLIVIASLVIYLGILVLQNNWTKAAWFLVLIGAIAFVSFSGALVLGGESIVNRFETLVEDDPITVYYSAGRGGQLEDAFTKYLFDYPLGAGLGRWGMMRYYFGNPWSRHSPALWAELQFPAWILDGGIILTALYCFALLATALYEYRLARSGDPSLRAWAAIIFAINGGTLGLLFGFTPFTTQGGLQYWFLAGALAGAARAHFAGRKPGFTARVNLITGEPQGPTI
jgi:hypothetical protein